MFSGPPPIHSLLGMIFIEAVRISNMKEEAMHNWSNRIESLNGPQLDINTSYWIIKKTKRKKMWCTSGDEIAVGCTISNLRVLSVCNAKCGENRRHVYLPEPGYRYRVLSFVRLKLASRWSTE